MNYLSSGGGVDEAVDTYNAELSELDSVHEMETSERLCLIVLSMLGMCKSFEELLALYERVALRYHLLAHVQGRLVSFCRDLKQIDLLYQKINGEYFACYLLTMKKVKIELESEGLFRIAEGSISSAYDMAGESAQEKLLTMKDLSEKDLLRLLKVASSVNVTKNTICRLFHLAWSLEILDV